VDLLHNPVKLFFIVNFVYTYNENAGGFSDASSDSFMYSYSMCITGFVIKFKETSCKNDYSVSR